MIHSREATSQVAMPAWIFGDCREGQIPRSLLRGIWLNDGSHIVYVNGSYQGEDAIGKLMHDFGCKESKDIYYPELAEGVKHFKEEGGRKIMCEAVEKYAQSYAEKYAETKRQL